MKLAAKTSLGELMAKRQTSVDPAVHPEEVFELFSIPAYDSGVPDIVVGSEIGSAKKVVKPGDVLLSRIVPHIRRAWVVPKSNGKRQIASGEWIVFRGSQFNASYLRHLLMSDIFHVQFMNTVAGVGGSLLRARPQFVAEIEFPLPPLPEQKRIAGILDRVDAIRRKRRGAIRESRALFAAALETHLETAESGDANAVPLERICVKITDGTHLTPQFTASGIPFIFVKNIVNQQIDFQTKMFIDEPAHKELMKRTPIEIGDVLYTTVGVTYGQAALVTTSRPFAFQRHIAHLKPDKNQIRPAFLAAVMNLPRTKRQADRWARGAAQPTLNLKELRLMEIPLPRIEVQDVIVAIKERSDNCASSQQVSDLELNDLFNTLVQRAFKGDL